MERPAPKSGLPAFLNRLTSVNNDNDDEEQHELSDDYDDEKLCKGFSRPCGFKAKIEGTWCCLCYQRRLKQQDRKEREAIKVAEQRRRREENEQVRLVRMAKHLARIEEDRVARSRAFRQIQQNLRARYPSSVLLIEEVPAAPAVAPVALAPPVAAPAPGPQPRPPQPGSVHTIPGEVAQRVIQVLQANLPRGTTVAQLRAIHDCPAEWSDQLLQQLIVAAGVGNIGPVVSQV